MTPDGLMVGVGTNGNPRHCGSLLESYMSHQEISWGSCIEGSPAQWSGVLLQKVTSNGKTSGLALPWLLLWMMGISWRVSGSQHTNSGLPLAVCLESHRMSEGLLVPLMWL